MRGATVTGTISNLSLAQLGNLRVPLPSLPEQRRIAEILDKADALRAKRRAAVAHLDILTQSIFLDMFGDPATNPKGWRRVALINLCSQADDIKCGPFGTQLAQSEFTTKGVPLWGIRNVNAFFRLPTHEFLEPGTANRLGKYSIQAGDIVMTRKGTVGNCSVYPANLPPGIMHSDLLRLRLNREHSEPAFVAHQLHYSRDVERQIALISGGAIMPGINVTKLKTLEVVVPPVPLQRDFADRMAAVDRLKTIQVSATDETNAFFASVQDRAFRGELLS
jgi:type I restriction enzyme S subunit